MSERLSREELAEIRAVIDDRRKRWEMSPGEALETIELLLEHIAALEAENERLRCALGTIAYDTSLSVPLGQEPGAHYRMMTHSCIITAVNALDEEVGE